MALGGVARSVPRPRQDLEAGLWKTGARLGRGAAPEGRAQGKGVARALGGGVSGALGARRDPRGRASARGRGRASPAFGGGAWRPGGARGRCPLQSPRSQ